VKVGILGSKRGWHVEALQGTLQSRGIVAPCFSITRLLARIADRPRMESEGESLDSYDVLFVRTIPGGSLEQIIFRVDALHRLENAGVRIVNSPTTIERTVDKYYTSSLLEDAGLLTLRTIVTERFAAAMEAFHELGGDVVVKPLFGSEGRGMVRVTDEDTAYRVFRALELGRYVYYLQEFTPHAHWDIRAFVIGGEVVVAMARRMEEPGPSPWKTNIARGGKGEPLELDQEVQQMALTACRALEADYAGVDILPGEDGRYYIIEVNGIPGWRGLQAATGVDVAELLADYILSLLQVR
jgi:RimK family alpha-L-glutamate ligase